MLKNWGSFLFEFPQVCFAMTLDLLFWNISFINVFLVHKVQFNFVKMLPFTICSELTTTLLQKVVEVLEGQSGPGGLHENTLLLVMGDHGQTINGDHGGGSAEEV